jgi:pimeloyl-ACP methyl ester carboxylesterase
MTTTRTLSLKVDGIGDVEVTVNDRGHGRPVLLLHGGGGPGTVEPWADRLAEAHEAQVFTPIHPGFDGTPRPETLADARGLAALYLALLAELDLTGVTVVGNSIGGWIAAEMAALETDSRVNAFVLVDAVGLEVPGHPVADFFSLTPAEIAQVSYHDPATFGLDPSRLPPEALARMAGNRAVLAVYGAAMQDASLSGRLAGVTAPTLVVWGEADRIADVDYGRAYAAAIPGARFEMLTETGHLPQIETPGKLIDTVWSFADAHPIAG